MINHDWIKAGQTVTDDRLKMVEHLPEAAKAEFWVGRTLNRAAVKLIMNAISSDKPKPSRKKKEGE